MFHPSFTRMPGQSTSSFVAGDDEGPPSLPPPLFYLGLAAARNASNAAALVPLLEEGGGKHGGGGRPMGGTPLPSDSRDPRPSVLTRTRKGTYSRQSLRRLLPTSQLGTVLPSSSGDSESTGEDDDDVLGRLGSLSLGEHPLTRDVEDFILPGGTQLWPFLGESATVGECQSWELLRKCSGGSRRSP